jgi:aspartyl-tRNA(Asn)/glutamyl-tRNA(Gln) amidotransferase subunit B
LWEEEKPQDKEVTIHWDDEKEEGRILREKESAADYRYFPEPDIPPFIMNEKEMESVSKTVGRLPRERRDLYVEKGVGEADALLLVDDPELGAFFDVVAESIGDYKRAKSVVLSQLMGFLNAAEKTIAEGPSSDAVLELLKLVDGGVISANAGKAVLEKMVETGKPAKEIVDEEGMQQVSDEGEIEVVVQKAIEANPQAVEDFRNGKEKALGAIVGFVMKETKGQANPGIVNQIVRRLLDVK